MYLRAAAHEHHASARFLSVVVGPHKHAEAGRVHECKLAQVKHQQFGLGGRDSRELLVEQRARGEIELSSDGQDHRSGIVLHV